MPRRLEALVVGKVIGEVVDFFEPSVKLRVEYPGREVSNGCEMKTPGLLEAPLVQIVLQDNNKDTLYTLIMTDPDAPSPSEPYMREWLHWIVTDIPAGADASYGREIIAYEAPKPTIGIHRYVFVGYQQTAPMAVMPPSNRNNFSTRDFAAVYRLGLPVAAVYFNAQKITAGRGRRSS
uniref:Flowering locus T/terminal flower 1-1 n=1 Tax=Equisetum giganteum TaxID=3259 RepID=A0A8E7IM08_EQUGI|nr:flowering locus T/terminal flower 1-1 [Equisetum giganteum]